VSSVTSTINPGSSAPFRVFAKLTKYSDDITIFIMKQFRWLATIIMVLITLEVVMRYIFRSPTIWNNDLQVYLSNGQRCIALGFATMAHSHIIMDVFIGKLSFKKSKILDLFGYIVYNLPLMILLTWATWNRGLQTILTNEKYYSTWRPPLWPAFMTMVFAYGLFIMQLFAECIKSVICLQRGNDEWLKQR